MAINCWAVSITGRPHVGLCHSVQGTARLLAGWIGAPYEEVSYRVAGINHQAWFLELRHRGEDAYPRLCERIRDADVQGQEPVRTELMRHFGYFVTESSGHASEYVPYLRKSPAMIEALSARFTSPHDDWFDWGHTGGYLRHCRARLATYLDEVRAQAGMRWSVPSSHAIASLRALHRSGRWAAYWQTHPARRPAGGASRPVPWATAAAPTARPIITAAPPGPAERSGGTAPAAPSSAARPKPTPAQRSLILPRSAPRRNFSVADPASAPSSPLR